MITFQNLMLPSQSPAATVLPSRRKATALMGEPWLCWEWRPKFTPSVVISVKVPSNVPAARVRPSGENATLRYAAACVFQMRSNRSARSQTLTTERPVVDALLADRQSLAVG